MTDLSFTPTSSIFEKREALLEEWTPEELVGRDNELQRYHAALQPVINNESPSNIFLYGKSGVGKTAATRYLLNALKRDAADVPELDLHTIEINCDGLNSSYQAAVALVNELRDPAKQISNTGYPQASVYQFLFEELNDAGGTVLLVQDDEDRSAGVVEFLEEELIDGGLRVAGVRNLLCRVTEFVDERDGGLVTRVEAVAVDLDRMQVKFRNVSGVTFEGIEEIPGRGRLSDTALAVEEDVGGTLVVDHRLQRGVIPLEFVVATDQFLGRPLLQQRLALLEYRRRRRKREVTHSTRSGSGRD